MFDAVRQRIFTGGSPKTNQELGGIARDVSRAFAALVGFALVEFTGIYTEPMYVGFDHEPVACLAVRVRGDTAPETPVTCGVAVHFVWEAAQKRLRVTSIDGLTPSGTTYRFAFLMVG